MNDDLERKLSTDRHWKSAVYDGLRDGLVEAATSITARIAFNYGCEVPKEMLIDAAKQAAADFVKLAEEDRLFEDD